MILCTDETRSSLYLLLTHERFEPRRSLNRNKGGVKCRVKVAARWRHLAISRTAREPGAGATAGVDERQLDVVNGQDGVVLDVHAFASASRDLRVNERGFVLPRYRPRACVAHLPGEAAAAAAATARNRRADLRAEKRKD